MKLKIGGKLFIGFALIVIIMIGLVGYNFFMINQMKELQDQNAKRSSDALEMNEISNLGVEIYRNIADSIINRDISAIQENFYSDTQMVSDKIKRAKELVDTEQEKAWLSESEKFINAIMVIYKEKIVPITTGNVTSDEIEIRKIDDQIDKLIDDFHKPIDNIAKSLVKENEDADKEYDKKSDNVVLVSIILAILGLILSIVIAFIITRSIVNPIVKVVGTANEISLGNLSIDKLQIKSTDETKDLADSFNVMLESLKYKAKVLELISLGDLSETVKLASNKDDLGKALERMVESLTYKENIIARLADGDLTMDVKIASDKDKLGLSLIKMVAALNEILNQVSVSIQQVASGSSQVSGASQSLSQGATEQASSLEEITSSITEINSQAKQNAENSIQANGLAKQAMEGAESGNNQMQELLNAMIEINKSADGIKKIAKAIDDISFQINLLALNANVEAARAGKYGKGFAVVADEVRNLAVKSAKSVKEATALVDESIKNIENGNKMAEITAKQIEDILNISSKVADISEETSISSKEQTQGLDQVTTALAQIEQVTQSNTSNAEETASAAEELAGQATQLREMINRFKLKDSGKMGNISQEMLEAFMKQYVNKEDKNKHIHNLKQINEEKKNTPIQKTQKLLEGKKEHFDPKDVIKLDDDDFGQF